MGVAAAVVLVAGLALPAVPTAPSDLVRRGCMGEVYTGPERTPELWRDVAETLRRTGITRPVAAMCYRGTGVWTGWVVTERRADEPPLWAVVALDGPGKKVLCVTSEDDGCRRYWNPPPR